MVALPYAHRQMRFPCRLDRGLASCSSGSPAEDLVECPWQLHSGRAPATMKPILRTQSPSALAVSGMEDRRRRLRHASPLLLSFYVGPRLARQPPAKFRHAKFRDAPLGRSGYSPKTAVPARPHFSTRAPRWANHHLSEATPFSSHRLSFPSAICRVARPSSASSQITNVVSRQCSRDLRICRGRSVLKKFHFL
jgi:hypothetical protein